MPNQKTTSEEWKSIFREFFRKQFDNCSWPEITENTIKQISKIILQKQKEVIEVERQRIWDIIVDEFEELQLSFHEGFGGNRISECQKKIVERIKIIQTAKEKFNIDLF